MSKRLIISLLIAVCACLQQVQAQYDVRLSQYYMAKSYYNPAVAGASDDLNIFGLARLEWVGVHGAPQSFFITADMPLVLGKSEHGVGVVVFTEAIGLFQNTHVGAQYAYKRKLFGGTLSGGLQVGMVNQSFDGTKVELNPDSEYHQETDAAFPNQQVSGMALDLNFGLYFQHKRFYLGLGMTHLTEPELQLDENAYTYIGRSLNFMGGYNIPLKNPLFELQPSLFLLTDMHNFHADITARLEYNKMFNGGISYRVNESVGVLLGVKIGRFQAGYAYDFPITTLGQASSGSHELCVRYALKLKKTKTGRNRHKSVRIL